jgi:uncharacterized protein (DUF433 family)
MQKLSRITMDPEVTGGKPCTRSMRVTVGTFAGLMASGKAIDEVLAHAAWRPEAKELPVAS